MIFYLIEPYHKVPECTLFINRLVYLYSTLRIFVLWLNYVKLISMQSLNSICLLVHFVSNLWTGLKRKEGKTKHESEIILDIYIFCKILHLKLYWCGWYPFDYKRDYFTPCASTECEPKGGTPSCYGQSYNKTNLQLRLVSQFMG